jgi:DNA-binding transcriptional regulator YiaG
VTVEDTIALAEARMRVLNGDLAAIRRRAKLSQDAIGRAVGVTRVTVCRWESGERVPSGDPAVRLARLLRELEALTKGSGRPEAPTRADPA